MSKYTDGGGGPGRGEGKKEASDDLKLTHVWYYFWRQSFGNWLKLFIWSPWSSFENSLLLNVELKRCGRNAWVGGEGRGRSAYHQLFCHDMMFLCSPINFPHQLIFNYYFLNHRIQRNTNLHWNTWWWIRIPSPTSTLRTRTCQILLLFKSW